MRKAIRVTLTASASAMMSSAALGDLVLMRAESQEWFEWTSQRGYYVGERVDFARLPDFGNTQWEGPIGAPGTTDGRIPDGFIPAELSFNASEESRELGLLGVGPSAGFGTPNLLLANHTEDSFVIDAREIIFAIDFQVWSILGSDTVTVSVGDLSLEVENGGWVGVGATGWESLGYIDLLDSAGGNEGLGVVSVYSFVGPTPGGMFLLGGVALLGRRRRREC